MFFPRKGGEKEGKKIGDFPGEKKKRGGESGTFHVSCLKTPLRGKEKEQHPVGFGKKEREKGPPGAFP